MFCYEPSMTLELSDLLKKEFDRRVVKNPRYSLRSFAKAVGIHPSSLSHIFSGSRSTPKAAQEKIREFLAIGPEATTDSHDLDALKSEVFETVSAWYHDAILELTHLKNFKGNIDWISKRLNLNPLTVKNAVARLCKLGLLDIDGKGRWIDVNPDNTNLLSTDQTSAAMRRQQLQMLKLSERALEEVPRSQRDHTSITISMDSKDLPKLKERIKQYRRKLMAEFNSSTKNHDCVYQIQISAFPATVQENTRSKWEEE